MLRVTLLRTSSSLGHIAGAGQRYFSSTHSQYAKVAVIGLGNMGGSMAQNLLKAGHTVTVFDVSQTAVKRLVDNGAKGAKSAPEAAKGAEAVVTMLPSSPHVKDVVAGKEGILKVLSPGAIVIDSSTIDPNVSREVAAAAEKVGVLMVDAPVSGGVKGAADGTLTFMVGGSEKAYKKAVPFLEAMGKKIVHCGGVGTGEAAKLCNNLALGIEMIAISEAMNLGARLGIDPSVLARNNPHPGVVETAPASRGYEGGFGTELMIKDIGLAIDAANSVKARLPLGVSAYQLFSLSSDHGAKNKDFSAVYELLSKAEKKKQ